MPPSVCPRFVLPLVMLGLMLGCQQSAEPRFAFSTDAPSRTGLVLLEDGVLVGNEAGRLVRLDVQGRPRWRVELEREIAASPTVSGESVLVGTVGGTLACLTLSEGAERWRLTGQPAVLTPLVSDAERVYVVAPDGGVRAVAVDSGEERWRRPLPPKTPRPESGRPLPRPLLTGGLLVVALGDAGLFALSPTDGTVRWRHPVAQVLGLEARADGTLYLSTRQGEVLALGLATGEVRWRWRHATTLTSPPSLARERLWVGSSDPLLLSLAPEDGRELSRLALPAPLVAPVSALRDWLLVPTRSPQGWLLALPSAEGPPALTLRVDTALLTRPVLVEEQLFVLGQDGRVLSWRLKPPGP